MDKFERKFEVIKQLLFKFYKLITFLLYFETIKQIFEWINYINLTIVGINITC